jgi:hypothetical protein
MPSLPTDELIWHRSRRLRRSLQERLLQFSTRKFGDEHLHEAWCDFHCARGCFPLDWNSQDMPMFLSWYHFVWRPAVGDDKEGFELLGDSVVEEFLQSESGELPDSEREYASTCAQSAFSFWQVTEVFPDQGLRAVDLLTGTKAWIQDKEFSVGLEVGRILFAMPVTVDGVTTFEAVASQTFPASQRAAVESLRQSLAQHTRHLTAMFLHHNTLELVDLYREFCTGGLRQVPPC